MVWPFLQATLNVVDNVKCQRAHDGLRQPVLLAELACRILGVIALPDFYLARQPIPNVHGGH